MSLLTVSKAADRLGVSVGTVHRWTEAGHIHVQRTLGGHRRYEEDEITRMAEYLRGGGQIADYSSNSRRATPPEPVPDGRAAARILKTLYQHREHAGLLSRDMVRVIREASGFQAVAIRIFEDQTILYEEQLGFSDHFTRTFKGRLSQEPKTLTGCADQAPLCLCSAVMQSATITGSAGITCTPGGSFWSNGFLKTLNETAADAFPNPAHPACAEDQFQSVAVLPLRCDDRIVGMLHFADPRPDLISPAWIDFFEAVGASMGVAVERISARAELLQSETRFFHMFSHMSNGVGIFCAVDNGRDFVTAQVNDAFERMVRVKREQIIGQPIAAAFPGVRLFELRDMFQRVWRTGVPEHQLLMHDSEPTHMLWLEDYIFKLPTGEIVAVLDDITARKRAEERLQASYRRAKELEHVITESPAICINLGAETAWPVHFATDNIQSLGYKPQGLRQGQPAFLDLFHPEDSKKVNQLLCDAVELDAGVEPVQGEARMIAASGEVRWVELRLWPHRSDGGALHLHGLLMDITPRKLAESAIKNQLSFMQLLIDTIPSPIFYKDHEGVYLGCNRAFEQFLGRSKNEIVGHTVYEVAPAELARIYHEQDCAMLCGNEIKQQYETTVKTADGSEREVLFTKAVFSRDGGPPDGLVGVMVDMTETHRLEMVRHEAESRKQQQMQLTERLHALEMLAAGMAHEINNPLQGMLTHLQAVIRVLPDDFERIENLQMIDRGIRIIADLVQQLMQLGSEKELAGLPAHLPDAVQFVLRLNRHQFENKGIEVQQQVDGLSGRPAISQQALIQILLNLVINARDAMPGGGRLQISAHEDPAGAHMILRVIDNGCGMDEETRAKAPTPFFTTKGPCGTGLGLSVVESLVRNSRGSMTVESEKDRGSTLTIKLPLMSPDELEETNP